MTQPAIAEPFKVTTRALKNGMRVALLRNPRARLTSIDLRFDVGTGDDPVGKSGFALLAGEALGLRSSAAELTSAFSVDLDHADLTARAPRDLGPRQANRRARLRDPRTG